MLAAVDYHRLAHTHTHTCIHIHSHTHTYTWLLNTRSATATLASFHKDGLWNASMAASISLLLLPQLKRRSQRSHINAVNVVGSCVREHTAFPNSVVREMLACLLVEFAVGAGRGEGDYKNHDHYSWRVSVEFDLILSERVWYYA